MSTATMQSKPFYTALTGDTKPVTMLIWFALLVLVLHWQSILWMIRPGTEIKKAVPPPIEVTLLAVPLKQADVVEPPRPTPPEPKKTPPPPKPKPKPVVKPKPLPGKT